MPGIAGWVGARTQEDNQHLLAEMAKSLQRSESHTIVTKVSPQAAFAAVSPTGNIAERSGVWLAVSGSVVEEGITDQWYEGKDNRAAWLLERYLSRGIEAVLGVNGSYSAAIWEPAVDRLTLFVDRLGTGNLYYSHQNGGLAFASEYKAILAIPGFTGRLSEDGLADLFLFGYVVDGRTLVSNIARLKPAEMLVWQSGKIHFETYGHVSFYDPSTKTLSERDYLAGMAGAMRTAVARRIRPDTGLLLTGGLDSRSIAGFYHQSAPQQRLHGLKVSQEGRNDLRVAQAIATRLGCSFDRIPIDLDFYERYGEQAVWRSEGKMLISGSWIFAAEPFWAQNQLVYSMTGQMGDQVSGRYIPGVLMDDPKEEKILRWLIDRSEYHLKKMKKVMRPEVFDRIGRDRASLRAEVFQKSEAADPISKFEDMTFQLLVPYVPQGPDILGDVSLTLDPFLDRDLVEYALHIPPSMRHDPAFYRQVIVRYLPEVSGIPHSGSGYLLPVDLFFTRYPVAKRIDSYRRRISQRILRKPSSVGSNEGIPRVEGIASGSRAFLEQKLLDEEVLGDLFDLRVVRQMLDDHVAGRADYSDSISTVATISIFRRLFKM